MPIHSSQFIGLDFETYGAVSLPEHGLERYVDDSSFRALIACTTHLVNGVKIRNRYNLWDLQDVATLRAMLSNRIVVAHNAGFEERVLKYLNIGRETVLGFIDSAVLARAMGAASKLEACAPQLLDSDKLPDGWRLIKLFSIPTKEDLEAGERDFDEQMIVDNPQDWELFFVYCQLDADLSLDLALLAERQGFLSSQEYDYHALTMEMNNVGWKVDVSTVEEMRRRYLENVEVEEMLFREECDAHELNLNSLKQLKEWCAERGIKATSFDEDHCAKLADKITAKLLTMQEGDPKHEGYAQVLRMLRCKQALGGSSLKKLKVILDTTSKDERLRDQYMHIGAGQTWRTTGRSVQMQNLKRLGPEPDDMLELQDETIDWDNDKLALNIRQVFTSSHPQGRLIVGDFGSVESRGLAWWAGAQWKLDGYRRGQDMYKVLASQQFGVSYEQVDKAQRTFGKVGELSCGYQAGAGAVQSFASGMGVHLTEAEAAKVVTDWRRINPEVVKFWQLLDDTLWTGFRDGQDYMTTAFGWTIEVHHANTPVSLERLHPAAKSLLVIVRDDTGNEYMRRLFHGVYERGRSLCYYKPTDRKSGPVWVNHFKDPKTKQVRFYNIYGGKLAGILTQSLCRQMFFHSLLNMDRWLKSSGSTAQLVGQFHDEIVVDWVPGDIGLEPVMHQLDKAMSLSNLRGFPLSAEIKQDYRYTK